MKGQVGELGGTIVGVHPFHWPGTRGELAGSAIGVVALQFDLVSVEQEARQHAFQSARRMAGGLFLLCLLFWFILDRAFTARVMKLVAATREIARGNLAAKSGLHSSDELGDISAALAMPSCPGTGPGAMHSKPRWR